ncbi:hypothetical protein D3C71_1122620 [compost metagenome]
MKMVKHKFKLKTLNLTMLRIYNCLKMKKTALLSLEHSNNTLLALKLAYGKKVWIIKNI